MEGTKTFLLVDPSETSPSLEIVPALFLQEYVDDINGRTEKKTSK